jgi:hypothetical protein
MKKWNKAVSEAEEIHTKFGETLCYAPTWKDEIHEVFLPTGNCRAG